MSIQPDLLHVPSHMLVALELRNKLLTAHNALEKLATVGDSMLFSVKVRIKVKRFQNVNIPGFLRRQPLLVP